MKPIPENLARRLHREAQAERWSVPLGRFTEALQASADRATPADVARYSSGLHLEDLALACACAAATNRRGSTSSASTGPCCTAPPTRIDPTGRARELADSLYADLYGIRERDGERQSLFRYFHGRSSLATWLRAVLAQRHVDALRADRRVEPLADEEPADALPTSPITPPDPDRVRYSRTHPARAQGCDLAADRQGSTAAGVLLHAGTHTRPNWQNPERARSDRLASACENAANAAARDRTPASRGARPGRGTNRALFCLCRRGQWSDRPRRYASQEFGAGSFNIRTLMGLQVLQGSARFYRVLRGSFCFEGDD